MMCDRCEKQFGESEVQSIGRRKFCADCMAWEVEGK